MRRLFSGLITAVFIATLALVHVQAAVSGAIFTTVADGSEVNFNIYAAKEDVYLDGGPGPGAPQHAAGLPDGTYVFQVTDPSGKTLLSTDPAGCRLFEVTNSIITSVAPSGACAHVTGNDVDHGALTVQLFPYDDTPNNGGEYKVWVTPLSNYVCNTDLSIVDCGAKSKGIAHGFVPRYSKTDNFKVRGGIREVDTRFVKEGNFVDGLMINWTDSLGGSNVKWSYYDPALQVNHEAHVEAVENGTHTFTIGNQAGCMVGQINVGGVPQNNYGAQDITVRVDDNFAPGAVDTNGDGIADTLWIDVYCQ